MAPLVTIDDIARLLDRGPLSIPGALLLTLLSYHRAYTHSGPTALTFSHLSSHKPLLALLAFVAVKSVNRALTRLVRNHGWKADKPRWEEEVVLITGGSTGIGKELVERLARRTQRIVVLDLAEPTYAATGLHYYKCDITDPNAIAEVAKQIRKDVGEPTIIVNNAGIARGKTILETKPEEFLLTYKVNVLGAHNILREFLPHIISIKFVSSFVFFSLARYNAPRVRTSVICPTKVSTQMGDAMEEQQFQFLMPTLQPQWLAGEMARIIESGLSDHLIAPGVARVMLPKIRSLPEWFRWVVNATGRTHETINDVRSAKQREVYNIVDKLDASHGLK
ncbi:hypothetical protein MNV49_000711 [Pseudohyphozyma bogoriensis]|nr:hypothetical protein MNV49_000711 [Pseudohyphozyma bogoriensis]